MHMRKETLTNSTPIVGAPSSLNMPVSNEERRSVDNIHRLLLTVKRIIKLDLPTPESPMRITLNTFSL